MFRSRPRVPILFFQDYVGDGTADRVIELEYAANLVHLFCGESREQIDRHMVLAWASWPHDPGGDRFRHHVSSNVMVQSRQGSPAADEFFQGFVDKWHVKLGSLTTFPEARTNYVGWNYRIVAFRFNT